jgi:hypothetical protein
MGTNYYAKTGKKITVTCDCGFEHLIDEELHIGKKSCGWKFTLHIIPEKGINELEDWRPILKSSEIYDEYDRSVSYDDMIKTIIGDYEDYGLVPRVKYNNYGYITMEDPNDGLLFVDHNKLGKEGSYCLMEGEFS